MCPVIGIDALQRFILTSVGNITRWVRKRVRTSHTSDPEMIVDDQMTANKRLARSMRITSNQTCGLFDTSLILNTENNDENGRKTCSLVMTWKTDDNKQHSCDDHTYNNHRPHWALK